jgi:hypothetical protein
LVNLVTSMKPVFQKHTDSSQPRLGDCLSACVASILELSLEEVPHFCHPEANWPHNYRDWFGDRGLVAIELKWPPAVNDVKMRMSLPLGTYFIAHGISPRGPWQHAVVAVIDDSDPQGWSIVHDPHPAGGGLIELKGLSFFGFKEPWRGVAHELPTQAS